MKKALFTFAIAAVTLISCSTDDSVSPTPPAGATGTLLKQVVDTYEDGSTATWDFTYDGNKLTSWVVGAGTANMETITYTYTNELLTGVNADLIDQIDDNSMVITYDANDKLSSISTTYATSGTTQTNYVYNSNGTVTATEGAAITTYTISNGNIVEEAFVSGVDNETRVIGFDTKNGCFKNIHQAEVLSLINDIYAVYNTMNNETSVTTTGTNVYSDETYTVSYTYSSNDYPVTSTRVEAPGTADEETITSTYTYY